MPIYGGKDKDLKRDCTAIVSSMEEDRSTWLTPIKEIAQLVSPYRFLDPNAQPGKAGRQDTNIYNMGSVRYLDRYAAGMQGGLSNKAMPWFSLEAGLFEGADVPPAVKAWLDEVTIILYAMMAHSNTYDTLYTMYHDHGGFGTAFSLIVHDYENVGWMLPFEAGRYMISQNAYRRVQTSAISYWETAPALVDQFGEDAVPEAIRNLATKNNYKERFEVIQIIMPNQRMLGHPELGKWKYLSIRYLKDSNTDQFLKLHGFNDNPVIVPRMLKRSDTPYGFGLGHKILGDSKQLQKSQKLLNLGIETITRPPVTVDGSVDIRQGVNLLPGGQTFVNGMAQAGGGGHGGVQPIYKHSIDISAIASSVSDTLLAIREGLFNDLFLMLANMEARAQITAEEIARRHQERVMMLGPIMEPLEREGLDPLITRYFNLGWDAGIFPEPPRELSGSDINIRYTSVLRQTMELQKAAPLNEFVSTIGTLAQIDQDAIYRLDTDEAIDEYHRILGAPGRVLRPKDKAWELIQGRNEQAQMTQSAETARTAAEAAKLASEANVGDRNVLEALTGATGGVRP